MTEETFSYVIARPWTKFESMDPQSLCVYAYHTEIQRGTRADAESFLEYVKFSTRNDGEKDYAIYKVSFEKL